MELMLIDGGNGKLYLFEKENKKWEVINIIDVYGIIIGRPIGQVDAMTQEEMDEIL